MATPGMRAERGGDRRPRCRDRITWILTLAGALIGASCAAVPATTPPASFVPATASASAATLTPKLAGTVTISGAATIPSTTFLTAAQMQSGDHEVAPPAGATCADYARGFATGFAPSAGPGFAAPAIQTAGYHNIYVALTMSSGYHGPGTYTLQNTPSMSGVAVEGIGTGSSAVYTVFKAKNGGRATLTVNADGSGSLQIDHWDSDEVRQAPGASQVYIFGSVRWVCHA
jgi:hypothetical protein